MCQAKNDFVKGQKSWGLNTKYVKIIIKLTMRSKVNVVSGSLMYVSHLLMVITQCAKYGKPVSNKNSYWPDTKTRKKNPYKFDLEFKVRGRILIMNVRDTSSGGDTPTCKIWWAKVKPKTVMGHTRKHFKNPINLTFKSKFKVVSELWMYVTYRLMVIHPCAKYDKPMSNQKKVMGRTWICTDRLTNRQTDRQTEWFLYTLNGGYKNGHNIITSKMNLILALNRWGKIFLLTRFSAWTNLILDGYKKFEGPLATLLCF